MNYIEVLDSIDAAVWGPPMIILLLGCPSLGFSTRTF